MGLYIIRRLGFLVVLIIGVSLMVFIISHMVPSDPVVVHLSKRNLNNPKMVAAFKEKWGLDKPLHIQYLIYLKKLSQRHHSCLAVTVNSISRYRHNRDYW